MKNKENYFLFPFLCFQSVDICGFKLFKQFMENGFPYTYQKNFNLFLKLK